MVSQLGDNVIDFFEAPSRGVNAGRNDRGVEIEFVALSLEPTGFDSQVINLANSSGFPNRGVDASTTRGMPRKSFSLFSGFPATTPPGALGFSNRRRIVVIDATDASNLIVRHNDLPLDSGSLGTTNVNLIRAAINEAEPAPLGVTYAAWSSAIAFPPGSGGFDDDPDGDGWGNGLEFYAATDPLASSEQPLQEFAQTATGFRYTYQRALDRVGVAHHLATGPLTALSPYIPSESQISVEALAPNLEKVSVALPADFGPFLRQEADLTLADE